MMFYFVKGLIAGLGLMFVVSVVLLVSPEIESAYFPVLTEFNAKFIERKGNVLEVTGSVRKARSCEYIHPWRARTVNSKRSLRVEIPPVDVPNWAPADIIDFGTIKIYGAGGEAVELYAEHRCHFGPTVISHLGVVS